MCAKSCLERDGPVQADCVRYGAPQKISHVLHTFALFASIRLHLFGLHDQQLPMRRAVIQNIRALHRPVLRRPAKFLRLNALNATARSIGSRIPPSPSTSSMRWPRRLSVPVAMGVAAAASYYAYQRGYGDAVSGALSDGPRPASSSGASGSSVDVNGAHVSEAVKKALIVDRGQIISTEIPAGQPVSKDTDHSGRKVLRYLSPEQASAKLRTNEESYLVGRGEGVVRYDVVQIPSNDPIEDDHVEKIVEVPLTTAAVPDGKTSSDWMFWGVFDGHSGWTTSAKLRQTLVSYVARELNETYQSALQNPQLKFPTGAAVDAAIKKGFVDLDDEITNQSVQKVLKAKSRTVAAEILAPALSGSCALLSFYDSRSKEIKVACTGDSRAVLGRRGASGKWSATPLSVDQTGGTASEDARLRQEHPGEPYVTMNGRILGGLEPSRAFGDASYKWSRETQEKMKSAYFGRSASRHLKTPPYVTAEPIVTTTKVEPAKGDFVVMATDGLWEMLTNEEVVGLVGQWLDKHAATQKGTSSGRSGWLQSLFASPPKSSLPVEHSSASDASGQRAPIRQEQWGVPTGEDARFVVEDRNAATHLVRNALGGRDSDMLSALVTLPAPFSRRYRDDLTVQVIFFGEGPGNGQVELNREASATAAASGGNEGGVKAKL